jgi:P27 family predicted phage terminase small subunit
VNDVAGARQPVQVILANGKKHLTKAEIEERLSSEPTPCTDDLTAPAYLSAHEKKRFKKIADQLDKLNVMGETDTETLARYVTAQTQYEKTTKELRAVLNSRPKEKAFEEPALYMHALATWIEMQTALAKLQDRYFKQAHSAATSLGLTISARCKLVVPKAAEEPKQNKFSRFNQGAG